MKLVRFVLLLSLAFLLSAQTLITVPVEINCDSVSHPVSTTGSVAWVQVIAPTTNTGVVRFGDSNVGASRGFPIAAGAGYNTPVLPAGSPRYALSRLWYYCATGDKVNIGWSF